MHLYIIIHLYTHSGSWAEGSEVFQLCFAALYTEPGLIPASHLNDKIFCNLLTLISRAKCKEESRDFKTDERLEATLNKCLIGEIAAYSINNFS